MGEVAAAEQIGAARFRLLERHEDVESVCSRCHHARENQRRAA